MASKLCAWILAQIFVLEQILTMKEEGAAEDLRRSKKYPQAGTL